jgi:beta-lactamase class A
LRAYQRALAGLSVILAVVIACLAATGGFLNPAPESPAATEDAARPTKAAVPGANATAPTAAAGLEPAMPAPVKADGTGASSTPAPVFLQAAAVELAVRDALAPFAGRYSVAVLDPVHGREVFVDAGEVFYAASTFKLALLYEALLRISDGRLSPTATLMLTEEAIAEDQGTLFMLPLDANGSIPLGDALYWMMTRSDNATAHALGRLMGYRDVDETLRSLGIETMSVNTRELPTTARDLASLMAALVRGDGLTPEARALGRDVLLASQWRDGIPAAIPDDVPVGNKTGNVHGATHDVAFVEAPAGTYIIAILSDRDWDWRPLRAVTEAVHAALAPR